MQRLRARLTSGCCWALIVCQMGFMLPASGADLSPLFDAPDQPLAGDYAGLSWDAASGGTSQLLSPWHVSPVDMSPFAAQSSAEVTASQSDPEGGGGASAEEMAAIGEALANPLSYLWMMFSQNDTIWYDGDLADELNKDARIQNTTLLQPVMSVQLTENWKAIFRPVIPINSFDTVGNVGISIDGNVPSVTGVNFNRETGLGDVVLWTAFSRNYTPPFVFGFGPTLMFDTASEDQLGSGKNAAGPMMLGVAITDKWIAGAVAQHWWSYSGDNKLRLDTDLGPVLVDRPDVNLTDIQPIVRYRLSQTTNIGMAPNWRYNHESDQLSLPIGIGFDTLVKLGPLPTKIGLEAYYYVAKDDDFGPTWQLRFLFVPVLPAPGWSRQPLF